QERNQMSLGQHHRRRSFPQLDTPGKPARRGPALTPRRTTTSDGGTGRWQHHDQARATRGVVFHPHAAAMRRDQALGNGEAEPAAGWPWRVAGPRSVVKWLEDALLVRVRNAAARVANA